MKCEHCGHPDYKLMEGFSLLPGDSIMQYQTCMPRTVTVGNTMRIEGVEWHCLEDCRLIGATMPENIPVVAGLKGAEVATTQFIQASECQTTPKSGDVRSASLILTQYRQINPEELKDKQIISARSTPEVLIFITADKQYVKIEPSHGYDDDVELSRMDCITVYQLHQMGHISGGAWEEYKEGCEAERLAAVEKANFQRFKMAAAQIGLGMDAVEKILRST